MIDFRGLLDDRSVNAAVAWLATGVLGLSAATLFATGSWLWGAFATLGVVVAVFPPVRTRELTCTLPGELVALLAVPVSLRAIGLFPQITPFATMAGLALLVLLVLDAFTSLRLSPRFAVLFVVVTTMAFAGVWAIAEFAADAVLGTDHVVGKREQNVDLIVATGVGLVAGVLCATYFHETDGDAPLERHPLPFPLPIAGSSSAGDEPTDGSSPSSDRRSSPTDEDGDLVGASAATDRLSDSPWYRYAGRALQVGIVAISVYALLTRQGALFANGVLSLAVTGLPQFLRWRYDYEMQAGLALLIAAAALLHVIGLLGPYEATGWYDTVTHALSSTLVAGVGYAIVRSIELDTDRVDFSSQFRGTFVVIFVLAVGVLWEIVEFGSGLTASFFGRSVLIQYGVEDIIKDLAFNAVGAVVVALWGTRLFRRPARVLTGSVGELLR